MYVRELINRLSKEGVGRDTVGTEGHTTRGLGEQGYRGRGGLCKQCCLAAGMAIAAKAQVGSKR